MSYATQVILVLTARVSVCVKTMESAILSTAAALVSLVTWEHTARKGVTLVTLESIAAMCVAVIKEQVHTVTTRMVTVHAHQGGMVFTATVSVHHRPGAMDVGILVFATTTRPAIL